HGLLPKLHVDQLTAGGGAELAAELECVSADHLDHASDAGLRALAAAKTVAVLLPGASMFVGDPFPDAKRFREAGVEIALSTDFNPGTSPTDDLALMGTMAMSTMGMTSEEALAAVTVNAAKAIAREDLGVLAPGKRADLVIWDAPNLEHLFWHFGDRHAATVLKNGKVVFEKDAAPECRPTWPPP
ncbi:MAG TPA: amidohydrolase family protein, partial [bacterium]|nr:amidohydrolase family protein [bacterium]